MQPGKTTQLHLQRLFITCTATLYSSSPLLSFGIFQIFVCLCYAPFLISFLPSLLFSFSLPSFLSPLLPHLPLLLVQSWPSIAPPSLSYLQFILVSLYLLPSFLSSSFSSSSLFSIPTMLSTSPIIISPLLSPLLSYSLLPPLFWPLLSTSHIIL